MDKRTFSLKQAEISIQFGHRLITAILVLVFKMAHIFFSVMVCEHFLPLVFKFVTVLMYIHICTHTYVVVLCTFYVNLHTQRILTLTYAHNQWGVVMKNLNKNLSKTKRRRKNIFSFSLFSCNHVIFGLQITNCGFYHIDKGTQKVFYYLQIFLDFFFCCCCCLVSIYIRFDSFGF